MFDRTKKRILQSVMNKLFLRLRTVPDPSSPGMFDAEEPDIGDLVTKMSLDEKLGYISGTDGFAIRAVPRLGIPQVWMSDATSGVRGVDVPVVSFPSAIAMAATWNRDLVCTVATMIGKECRASGISILLAPGVNIARVPVCGRNFEYMGEDPFLAGEIASAYVAGVQTTGVGVTVKHFACNNSEYDRHKSNSIVGEKVLRELYLKPFEIAVRNGATGIMSAYNQINGEYASEHPHLIHDILRGEWGFEGLLVSDWNSLYSTEGAFLNGVDIEMPKERWFGRSSLKRLVERNPALLASLDQKVIRILGTAQKLGVINRPTVECSVETEFVEHRDGALHLAREAAVLLKNDDLLPLDVQRLRKIVVLGNAADGEPIGGGGSSFIKQANPGESLASHLASQLEACSVSVCSGRWWLSSSKRRLVSEADAVVVSTGFDHVLESESYDRPWYLEPTEEQTILEACALNDRVTVILHAGGASGMASWIDKPQAVLMGWYLGEMSACALADILLGEANPSGKLPITIGKRLEDYESMKNYPDAYERLSLRRVMGGQGNPDKRSVMDINYQEGLMVGYRQFDTVGPEPLFPFGFGLSYTSFDYSDLSITGEGTDWIVTWNICNTGNMAGAEVSQLYLRPSVSDRDRPFQQLCRFEKRFLEPGDSATVSVTLSARDFSIFSLPRHAWEVAEETYGLVVGTSSRDIRLESRLEIQKIPGSWEDMTRGV